MDEYKFGDRVDVKIPGGWKPGRVVTVLPNYAWTGETHYSIHGENLVTITSARNMRPTCKESLQVEGT